ncbi:hypothetical protein GCM10009801_72420 [Streptomyces albiaxialis]|uniref:DUF3558 domain-containing protein n=1 Tax=Streptomyces albiaxialis TaxID=329523 RepID=A0ABP5IL51_9ACTN
MRHGTTARRAAGALAALALAVGLTGCADEGRDFAVPGEVCGTTVDKDALGDLLPPEGKKLRETDRTLLYSDDGCTVEVDHYPAVVFGWATVRTKQELPSSVDPVPALKAHQKHHVRPLREMPVKGKGAVADEAAMLSVPCEEKGAPEDKRLLLEFHFGSENEHHPEDVQERRKAITAFVEDIAPHAVKKHPCGS